MQQTYFQIIQACERALADFEKTRELLEYPEVQADKAYYLSVLQKFNRQNALAEKLSDLKLTFDQEKQLTQAMPALSEEERELALEEIAVLRQRALTTSDTLAEMLGCAAATENIFCRILASDSASELCEKLFELVKQDLLSHGTAVNEVNVQRKKSLVSEISFTATGRHALARLAVLSGVHKVQNTSAEVVLAVTPAASVVTLDERDVKIDLFHSGGAGGQNINKVETAVRATHIPTGTVVTCQDERSQLKNKRRALENLEKRLKEQNAELEKKRMDADVKEQLRRLSTLSFTANGELVDKANGLQCASVPEQFSAYINLLLSKQG